MAVSSAYAQDEYRRAQNAFNNAVSDKRRAEIDAINAIAQRYANENTIKLSSTEKLNLERRVADLTTIINLMEDSVNNLIVTINNTAVSSDQDFRFAVKHDLYPNASIEIAFSASGVMDDIRFLSPAHQVYITEKQNTQQAIIDLENKIRSMNAEIDRINQQINNSNIQQMDFQRIINNSAANMAYYRRFI